MYTNVNITRFNKYMIMFITILLQRKNNFKMHICYYWKVHLNLSIRFVQWFVLYQRWPNDVKYPLKILQSLFYLYGSILLQ